MVDLKQHCTNYNCIFIVLWKSQICAVLSSGTYSRAVLINFSVTCVVLNRGQCLFGGSTGLDLCKYGTVKYFNLFFFFLSFFHSFFLSFFHFFLSIYLVYIYLVSVKLLFLFFKGETDYPETSHSETVTSLLCHNSYTNRANG